MAEYLRVVNFEADAAATEALVADIAVAERTEGIPATRITVLRDRDAGQLVVVTRFASREDLDRGAAILEGMSPPPVGAIRRVSVDVFEVLLDRDASA